MPRFNIKHTENGITKYMHFSGVSSGPITDFLDYDNYKKFYISEYSEDDFIDFEKGNRNKMTLTEAINDYNLNSDKDDKLNKKQFLEKFKFYNE